MRRASSPSSGRLDFHGVAMRPSSPAGRRSAARAVAGGGERFVFLLPGNPVSCLCAYEFFAGTDAARASVAARAPGRTAA